MFAQGRLIEVPGQDDRPNFLIWQQSRAGNVGELLTVIVSPQPLEGFTLTENAQRLTLEQIKLWEQP
jgi:hypothetical protein